MFKSTVHRIQLRQARQAKSKEAHVCFKSALFNYEFGIFISRNMLATSFTP